MPHDVKFWSLFAAIWIGLCLALGNIAIKIELLSQLAALSD
jgi:hypothetical protein